MKAPDRMKRGTGPKPFFSGPDAAEASPVQALNRRRFLQGVVALGTTALLPAGAVPRGAGGVEASGFASGARRHGLGTSFRPFGAGDVIYTLCEQCNTHCSIRVQLEADARGRVRARKIAGNPYSPLNTVPYGPIPYETPAAVAAAGEPASLGSLGRAFRGGRICLKGQAGIQTAYDRLRVRTPLRRVGPRGSGQWESLTWEEALREIVEGSPTLGTPGLREMWAYVPKEEVDADRARVASGSMSRDAFREKYRELLIDPDHPEFGPRANQIVNLGGDRRDFIQSRVWPRCLGSVNAVHHGGICGMTGVQATQRSYVPARKKQRLYADLEACQFLLVWGSNPLVANKGPTWLAPAITRALDRGMRMAVVDPRLSKTAEKASMWVPVRPGGDGALAMGMARWIVENRRYDRRYLENPNREAARADGEPTWSDATYLVRVDESGRPFLRPRDLGLPGEGYVVLEDGKCVPHHRARQGTLEVETELPSPDGRPIRVRSVFSLYRERLMEHSLETYAEKAGIPLEQLVTLAREWTAHGKRAAMIVYRGPAMHANGYDAVRAINSLNHLIGNHDWKGGSITTGARYDELAGRYDLLAVPGGFQAWGLPLVRSQSRYEQSDLFQRDGYPARRPWFPLSAHQAQEVLASAADGYPYPINALFIHRLSPVVSSPAGAQQEEILKDPQSIPLLVSMDVVVGESSQYADFILPDLTYLERWGRETIYPNVKQRLSTIMQPVVRVFDGPEGPRSVEDVWIDLLKRMGLPGVGSGAFSDGGALDGSEDFYLRMAANIALSGDPVPDATPDEERIFLEARRKALGDAFDPERWKGAVAPDEWPKVVTVLNRGGRFEAPGSEYEGEWLRYRYGDLCHFYDETASTARSSYDGRFFDGLPRLDEPRAYDGSLLADRWEGGAGQRYPLQMIHWKARWMGTHRNISNVWLREVRPENYLWMHPQDAVERGVGHGQQVRVTSAGGEAVATVWVTEAIRPGVVGAAFSYGHTAYGSRPVWIDGRPVGPAGPYGHTRRRLEQPGREETGLARGRGTGFSINHLLPQDPGSPGAGVTDPVGGGAAQYDLWVQVERLP